MCVGTLHINQCGTPNSLHKVSKMCVGTLFKLYINQCEFEKQYQVQILLHYFAHSVSAPE